MCQARGWALRVTIALAERLVTSALHLLSCQMVGDGFGHPHGFSGPLYGPILNLEQDNLSCPRGHIEEEV